MQSKRFLIGSLSICLLSVSISPVLAVPQKASKTALPGISISKNIKPKAKGIPSAERYSYHSQQFYQFVKDSYQYNHAGNPRQFFNWFENTYKIVNAKLGAYPETTLDQFIASRKNERAKSQNIRQKTQREMLICAETHRLVKTLIPRFNLTRGFEFTNTVKLGERQCFLQSVLIAGLLQDMGIDSGVVMIYKNAHGEESNNGHAVTLVKLTDGTDILLDASEQTPFVTHRGIYARASGYRYLTPVFQGPSKKIISYKTADKSNKIQTSKVRTMDINFIRSQFDYYRGERAKNGILWAARTPGGMEASLDAFKSAVQYCPQNTLALYMLAKTYFVLGDTAKAQKTYQTAVTCYSRAGWTPAGIKDLLKTSK